MTKLSRRGESCLPDDCALMCALADSLLVALMERIVSGEVSFKEMELVSDKQYQLEKLCNATQEYKIEDIKALLERRRMECRAFRRRKQVLTLFCNEMKTAKLNIKG